MGEGRGSTSPDPGLQLTIRKGPWAAGDRMSEPESQRADAAEQISLDPAQQLYLTQGLQAEQNLVLGTVAGLASALVGAGVWAGVTIATGYQIGFMAIGVGFVVGFAVRVAGNGVSTPFGVIGAVFALLGCALGNLLAVTAMVADGEGVSFLSALGQLDPGLVRELMVATFSPMDLLFYGIAIYEGYRLSFRQLTSEELQHRLSGGPAA